MYGTDLFPDNKKSPLLILRDFPEIRPEEDVYMYVQKYEHAMSAVRGTEAQKIHMFI